MALAALAALRRRAPALARPVAGAARWASGGSWPRSPPAPFGLASPGGSAAWGGGGAYRGLRAAAPAAAAASSAAAPPPPAPTPLPKLKDSFLTANSNVYLVRRKG